MQELFDQRLKEAHFEKEQLIFEINEKDNDNRTLKREMEDEMYTQKLEMQAKIDQL